VIKANLGLKVLSGSVMVLGSLAAGGWRRGKTDVCR
jgi:hypothetical protein